MGQIYMRLKTVLGTEVLGILLVVIVLFGLSAPKFLSYANFGSVASQLPVLGLLTLAMLVPIISGGFNLANIYTANMAGLMRASGPLLPGRWRRWRWGGLAMMIFLRGLGEYLTEGGDISGLPVFMCAIGYGQMLGIPAPLWIFAVAALVWHVILNRTRHGFAARMIGSNIRATTYSAVHSKRTQVLIYDLSGMMCAIAGILMLAQDHSLRVGHGEALLLVKVLACFLGGVDPFGGFGRVLPVVVALVVLQVLSSGLNLLGANQHLSTAVWGLFLIGVMILRWTAANLRQHNTGKD